MEQLVPFLKKYRRSIVLGVVAGTAINAAIRVRRAFDDSIERFGEAERQLEALKTAERSRRAHLSRINRESQEALPRFLPPLERALNDLFKGKTLSQDYEGFRSAQD